MSLFTIDAPAVPKSQQLAEGFLKETNQKFETELAAVYDAVQRFWYRNEDEDGNPSLTGDEPSGEDVLRSMGTNAKAFMDAAYARVVMLVTIQTSLGLDIIDMTKVSAPFDMTFKADGSLNTVTPKA